MNTPLVLVASRAATRPAQCTRGFLRRAAPFVVCLMAASCQATEAPLPARPALVDITTFDRRFSYEKKSALPAGRAVFHVRNQGTVDHEVVLVPLPEDFPSIEVQLRSDERVSLNTLYNMPAIEPDSSNRFAVDLVRGRYGMVCFLTNSEGTPYALNGMASEFRVR